MKEVDIINRILAGETELFSVFVDDYATSVFRMVKQIVTCHEDAEEIVQDVFVKAFRKLHTFKGEARFSTWLYRIAYNTAVSATRRKKQEYLFFDEKEIMEVPDETIHHFFENDRDDHLILKLREAVDLLSPEDRALVNLYYAEDKPVNEIATITGISRANVKIKLFRIRKKLYLQVNQP